MSSLLKRVGKKNPCPICKHDSWCLANEVSVLCMRASSANPYMLKNGEQGYWHQLTDKPVEVKERYVEKKIGINAKELIEKWQEKTKREWLDDLSNKLHVSTESLESIGTAWAGDHQAWAFPMMNGNGSTVGIRLRSESGRKWAVSGSFQGIFAPKYVNPEIDNKTAFICEGPTDTAALTTLGLLAIGRPSCSGGSLEIKRILERLKVKRVVIIADGDKDKKLVNGKVFNPGWDGAKSLVRQIPIKCCIIFLPCKDARQFVEFGGTAEGILDQVKNVEWENVRD